MKFHILLLMAVTSQLTVADIYINNLKGSDSNSGDSPEKALRTIRAGIRRMHNSKSKVMVLTKTDLPYYESIRLLNFNGTPEKPIIIEGNGAIISGIQELPTDKWQQSPGGIWFYPKKRYGALCPYLIIAGKRVPGMPLEKLQPMTHFWSKKGVFFKPGHGKSVKDYKIFATVLTSGFMVNNSSYITCRNLTAEYFSNDGFNIHGNSQGLIFENITGRRNGDDGFSIHEDVGTTVRGGHFYENNYGIQDVNASRSEYYGVTVNDNRRIGINLLGGSHAIVDASVKNNKWAQIQLESDSPSHLHFSKNTPVFTGSFYIKNISVSGGTAGLKVTKKAAVTASNCLISGCTTGVIYQGTGSFHIYMSIIRDCKKTEINANGRYFHSDLNCYYPGRFILNGKKYSSKMFKQWKADSNSDCMSILKDAKNAFYLPDSKHNKRHIKIGPNH